MESHFPIIIIGLVVAGLLLWLLLRRRSIQLPPSDEAEPHLRPGERAPLPRAELGERADRVEPEAERAPAAGRAQTPPTPPGTRAPSVPPPARGVEPSAPQGAQPTAAEAEEAAEPLAAGEAESLAAPQRDVELLRKGLANTRGGFIARLAKLFGSRPTIDEALIEQIEEVLITADIGVKTSARMLARLRQQMQSGKLTDADEVWRCLREMATEVLQLNAKPLALQQHKPSLILIVGVNGAGKTTTIGKLAARYTALGRRVLLAAGDTYRAAAVLQLEVWGRRVNCPVIKGKEGADPSGVIFDAIKRAQEEAYDLVIADTAGRLHTKAPLMEELKKVDRTIQKALGDRGADEILLVLDATTGQNAVQQMHMFREALQISGVVLTKLDGTAKGGMILGIVDEHKIPIRFVGLGERVEDLREFDAKSFVEALFTKPDGETLAA
jgi:fused signal recognition particle receptor